MKLRIPGQLRCWLQHGGHEWQVHQHTLKTDDRRRTGEPYGIVIAFKVCKRCVHSKLIHLLE